MYGDHRRRDYPRVHADDRPAGGKAYPHRRGAYRRRKRALYVRLRRGRSRAVRLLHSGYGAVHEGASRSKPEPDGRGNPLCAAQQLLSLYGLCEDHRGRASGGEAFKRGRCDPGPLGNRLEGRLERPPSGRGGKGAGLRQVSRRLLCAVYDLRLGRPREIRPGARQIDRRFQGACASRRVRSSDGGRYPGLEPRWPHQARPVYARARRRSDALSRRRNCPRCGERPRDAREGEKARAGRLRGASGGPQPV